MNFDRNRLIRTLSYTMLVMAAAMLPSLLCAFLDSDMQMAKIFLFTTLIPSLIGTILFLTFKPSHTKTKVRDIHLNIFLTVVISCIIGAFPYWLGMPNVSFVDAIFESTAGLSTTSATVIYEPIMGNSLLLWKSMEHWIGGIIILIFAATIFPGLGAGDQQLATAEGHGTMINRIAPRKKVIVKYLICIYLLLTVVSFIYFLIGNIGGFDSLILSLSTSSTSGVLIHPEGISYYNSSYIEMGVPIFSILSGISFVFYIHFYRKNYLVIKRNIELRAFFIIIITATIIVGALLFFTSGDRSLLTSFRDSFFQVASFSTTSGFALEDYTIWPSAAKFILLSLMIIGGCSASTTGSFKVMRLLITLKLISRGIVKRIHPRAVKSVKIGNSPLSATLVSSVTTFAILFFGTLLFSSVILSLQNLDLETTLSAAIGTMSNSGISLGEIGMSGDYSMFHPLLKIYLSFLMIVGRLGLLTIFIIFAPSFWNPNKKIKIK